METHSSKSTLISLASPGQIPMVNMTHCDSCGSTNLGKFLAEISIHFPGLKNIDKAQVLVFPQLVVCLACGAAQFTVGQPELNQLANP